jgi:class 3 adenylate cyclase
MKSKQKIRVHLTDQMVLIGFGLAAVYWVLDTFMSLFLSSQANLFEQLFGVNLGEVSTRLIVLCLFIIFGSHAQFTINERRQAEEQSRREAAMRERFQRLLSPDLAEMVVSGQLNVEKGGESRVATVLFVDIRDFTAMSEHTRATEILQILNEYYEVMVDIAFRHEGTVDKFIGDAMMVIWGAPVAHPDDPVRAVRAAVEMQKELTRFNQKHQAVNQRAIQIGIGINTGNLVAGYIGSSQTMSYSVIGDTVNTAARICGIAKPGQIIISENTYQAVRHAFQAASLDPVQFKGKFKPVQIYSVTGNLPAPASGPEASG